MVGYGEIVDGQGRVGGVVRGHVSGLVRTIFGRFPREEPRHRARG